MTQANMDEIRNRFAYHPATEVTGPIHDDIRKQFTAMAESLLAVMPPGRHASLALTTLEEAMHWANAAVACDT